MKRERKKSPADYPQFAFRVSKEDKEQLSKLIAEVCDQKNKLVKEDEKVWRLNDVIVEALKRGLSSMRARS